MNTRHNQRESRLFSYSYDGNSGDDDDGNGGDDDDGYDDGDNDGNEGNGCTDGYNDDDDCKHPKKVFAPS